MAQEHARHRTERQEEAPADEQTVKNLGETAAKDEVDTDVDDLLSEIDEVLESNAEDFVKSYIQKGGQ